MRYDYQPEDQIFWEDFLMQGNGLGAFSGIPYQRGAGIGGLFRGLFRLVAPAFRKALPFLKNVGLDVGKRAVEAGADIIGNVSEGQNFSDSTKSVLKNKSKQALGDFGTRLSSQFQEGKGVGSRVRLKPIKRKHKMDIYDIHHGKVSRRNVAISGKKRS